MSLVSVVCALYLCFGDSCTLGCWLVTCLLNWWWVVGWIVILILLLVWLEFGLLYMLSSFDGLMLLAYNF